MGCDTFAPDVNGAARFAERLAAGLVERGHTVHVIAPSQTVFRTGHWDETHAGARLHMHRLFSLRWYPHPWLRYMMPWTIRRNTSRILDQIKPDAVHFQSHFVVGRGLSVTARSRGIRVVATNHTMPENMIEHTTLPKFMQPALLKWAWWDATKILKRADAVTTPTRRAADYLEEATGITGVHAIGNGVRVSDYTPDFEHRGSRIVFVGRITGEKRLEVLVHAVALLPKSLDWSLEIVGDGEQRHHLERLAAQLGVGERVTLAGLVSDAELKQAYTRADVLAMPSTAELQSIVTMEAMSSGLPVVAADAMALPHLVHDGENGFLFRPDDAQDLAAKLEKILTLPDEEFTRMKKASLRLIQAHDIERTLTTFECLYRGKPVVDPVTEEVTEGR
ncbi:glycosyltransferase family 4 protein [Gryllotalpicola protaetiae]|uniref:D-inositol 3-phosphate glycosyltransferase n=1 Tax=Gryllotalpicola protaetiae TaxID=2419771 RepID=A0A387BSE7_9MICO|nr:glycosyltransferase family 4 protein [Gryllotalpicola protaetiae]